MDAATQKEDRFGAGHIASGDAHGHQVESSGTGGLQRAIAIVNELANPGMSRGDRLHGGQHGCRTPIIEFGTTQGIEGGDQRQHQQGPEWGTADSACKSAATGRRRGERQQPVHGSELMNPVFSIRRCFRQRALINHGTGGPANHSGLARGKLRFP